MHPILFKIGSFEMGTYGFLLAGAFFAALWLAKRQARLEGVDPEAIVDVAIACLIAGIVGSKVLMMIVDLLNGSPASYVFSLATLRAGGHVHGGIIAGVIALLWRLRSLKLAFRPSMDIVAPAISLGQGLGRLGCLAAGCCYGAQCDLPWAITFHSHDAARLSGTPLDVHLHPIQLYLLLANLATMAFLLWWRGRRAFQGQIFALYFMIEGVVRATMEAWRGDADRGFWLGLSWLSTGRLTAFGFILFGLGLWVWARKRPAAPVAPQAA